MEDMNLLVETGRGLEELATDCNLLNDKNIIGDSLALDENTLASNPASSSEKESGDVAEENREDDDESKSNKENEPNAPSDDVVNDVIQLNKPCQFAISRIKTIMKLDPDLGLMSKESVFLIAKATVKLINYSFF